MVTVISTTYPRARTEHRCCLCYRTITKGEKYERQFNTFDGNPYVWKSCVHCTALAELYGPEWWDDGDGWNEDTVHSWEPDTIAGLRAKVMWQRGWTRRDGDLYPIPEAPEQVAA